MGRLTTALVVLGVAGVASAQTVSVLGDLTPGDPIMGDFPVDPIPKLHGARPRKPYLVKK